MRRLVLALLLLGCAPARYMRAPEVQALAPVVVDRTIHGDTRFYREERWIVEYAALAWNEVTQGRVRLAVVWDWTEDNFVDLADKPHLVRAPRNAPSVAVIDARSDGLARGWVHGNSIVLVPERCPELYPVILHELGHFVGLEDLKAPGSVMNGYGFGSWKFQEADLRECVRVGVCEGGT